MIYFSIQISINYEQTIIHLDQQNFNKALIITFMNNKKSIKVKRSMTKEDNTDHRNHDHKSLQPQNPLAKNRTQIYKMHVMGILAMQKRKRFSIQEMFPERQSNSSLSVCLPKINQPKPKEQKPQNNSMVIKQSGSTKIPLKPVPKSNPTNKSSFGWIIDKNQPSAKQQLIINKGSKSYSIESEKYKNQWHSTLREVKKDFQIASSKIRILPASFWPYLISKFQKFHLHVDQKVQLLELVSKFLENNSSIFNERNQFQFCQKMGTKFQKMENRIYFKHKYSLQYAKFMIAQNTHKERFYSTHFFQFNFDLKQKEVFQLFAIVRQFCQNNMDAFAFITLYFQISLKKLLKTLSFKKVEDQFVKLLISLSKKYPPSQEPIQQTANSYGLQNIPLTYKFEVFSFTKSKKSHFQQLKQHIIKQIESAKQQQSLFREIVEDICFKYGYSFKSGVKIKSAQSKASIFRTIEKLLSKNQFKEAFTKFRKELDVGNSESSKFSQDKIRVQIQKTQKKIIQILEGETSIQIDAKDLVRGKCTFSKIEEIIETVKLLKAHIESEGYEIIELKNRLRKQTKDVSIIIKLPRSIAELQLALKLDSVSNEFNHKIFELARSQMHTPITNLFVHNERWCQTFFTDQFQLFQQIINMPREPELQDEITFRRLKKDITIFKDMFLQPNGVKYEKNFRMKQEEKLKILEKVKEIKKLVQQLKRLNMKEDQKRIIQRQNLINFYKTFDYEKALETVQQIQEKELQAHLRLMKLKGDILNHHGKHKQSLDCYLKYVSIHKKTKQHDLDLADVLQNIGQVFDIRQEYHEAIEYYQKSLEIKEQLNGQETVEVAASLSGIGEVYSNMKTVQNYAKSLDYHTKALKIRERLLGKENVDVAASLNLIGVVLRRSGDYEKALDFLKQSLQIRQKVLGKESLDAANSLYNIGIVYRYKKEGAKCLEYLHKAIELKEKILGRQSLAVAKVYLELSYAFEEIGQLQKAQNSISFAYLVFRKILGEDHGKTKLSYEQYRDVRQKLQRKLKGVFFSSKLFMSLKLSSVERQRISSTEN